MSDICCLCSQIAGDGRADLLASVLGEPPGTFDRIIRAWRDFVVFPSIGALTPGHVLLCPRLHVRSMAALPRERVDSLTGAVKAVRKLLARTFGAMVHAFEHGSSDTGDYTVCTVDHAHLHFVPVKVDVELYLQAYRWVRVRESLSDIVRGGEYLYYESPTNERWVTTGDSGAFPSQYFRRVFAEALGVADRWNWRVHPAPQITRKTLLFLGGQSSADAMLNSP